MIKGVRANWFAATLGGDNLPLVPLIVSLGGHVRLGLEDYQYAREGQPTNAQLTERAPASSARWAMKSPPPRGNPHPPRTLRVPPKNRSASPRLSYLIDPWIWLCVGLGFGVMASGAILTYLLGIYTAAPECKMSPYPAMTLQLAYLVYIVVALGIGMRVSSRQPYTFAFSVGVGSDIPLMFRVGRKLKSSRC